MHAHARTHTHTQSGRQIFGLSKSLLRPFAQLAAPKSTKDKASGDFAPSTCEEREELTALGRKRRTRQSCVFSKEKETAGEEKECGGKVEHQVRH